MTTYRVFSCFDYPMVAEILAGLTKEFSKHGWTFSIPDVADDDPFLWIVASHSDIMEESSKNELTLFARGFYSGYKYACETAEE